jgi:hypothetical protein
MKGQLYLDEARSLISRFLEQTVKDYLNAALRFSPLQSEREYYETARDFLHMHTAILWGDTYFSIVDMLAILNIDYKYMIESLKRIEKDRTLEYTNKILRKDRTEVRALFTEGKPSSPSWKRLLSKKLKKIGIKYSESRRWPDEEISEIRKENVREYKNTVRKIIDVNVGLVNNSDMIILRWKKDDNISDIVHEISHAYVRLVPIFIITSLSIAKVPRLLFAYCNNMFDSQDQLMRTLQEKVGKKYAVVGTHSRRKIC